MLAELHSPSSPAAPAIAVIAALSAEKSCLRGDARVGAHQCGPGAERAFESARQVLSTGAEGIVSWGFAGALDPGVEPATLIVPSCVLLPDGARFGADERWQGELARALSQAFTVHEGHLLCSPQVLETPRFKARAALGSGAVAVDMESAGVARAAREAGKPFVAVKVVLDALGDSLPASAEGWIDSRGETRLAAAFGALLRPLGWHQLFALGQRYRGARRALTAAARLLTPQTFFFPYPTRSRP